MHFWLLIGLIASASANDKLKNTLQKLSHINQNGLTPEVQQCTNESVIQKCLLDLCGPPNTIKSAFLTDKTFDTYVKPDAMKRFTEVEEELKKLIKTEVENNKKFITKMKEKLGEKDQLTLNFDSWTPDHYESISDNIFRQHYDLELDLKQELSKRLTIKTNYPERDLHKGRNKRYF